MPARSTTASEISPPRRRCVEAWEKGLLGPDQTNGLKLEWAMSKRSQKLLDMAARREGWFGGLLAEGPKQLAEAIGGDAPNWAVSYERRNAGHA